MNLTELSKQILSAAQERGFYIAPNRSNVGECCALMHSEISELLEAHRNNKVCQIDISNPPEKYNEEEFKFIYDNYIRGTVEEEAADIIIGALEFIASRNIDIQAHVDAKLRYNKMRGHLNGKKY